MRIGFIPAGALILSTLWAPAAASALPAPASQTLWISDDVNTTIYHVKLDGTVLSSFASGSISELALGTGADAGTLWAAKEGSNLIVHFDQSGQTLSSFPGTAYDPAAISPEGVAVDFADGTLWIVDDVTDLVYHVEDDGTPLGSFSAQDFDPAATSPQGIACDPTDGTLWIADNVTHRVYNLTTDGTLLSSFPASAFGPVTLNLQGISVDETDRSLWLTARNTHLIYHVSRAGVLQSTLDASVFGSLDPTGVAVQLHAPMTFTGLVEAIDAGLQDALITPGGAKKLTHAVRQAQKQFEKAHPAATMAILEGFQEQVYGLMLAGDVDEGFGRELLAGADSLLEAVAGG